MLAQRIDERREQLACCSYPACQRGAIQIHAFTRIDIGLAIEWAVVGILRDQHMRQQVRAGEATLDRPCWSRCFNNALALLAGELRPHMTNDLERCRDALQLLGHIFAELAQRAAAIGAAVMRRQVRYDFARKMLRQRPARRAFPGYLG